MSIMQEQVFTFELTFEPDKGSIWLRLRGNVEIKAFVQKEFTSILW
jgi:hypothetical protein